MRGRTSDQMMRGWVKTGVLVAAAWSLAGCSGIATLNALEPKGGVAVIHDVPYQTTDRGTLDIYRPKDIGVRTPVVVFFYGGGWDSGRKADYAFAAEALARRGFLTIVPDYRLYPEVRWPTFLDDCAAAVAWTKTHAADYRGDPGKLVLMGHSAGAYNAVMLAVDRRWLGKVGIDPSRDIRAVVGLAGPYDFLPLHSDELKIIFGPEAQRPDTQPINHVDGKEPPMFLATDTADKVVDPGNTTRMAARITAAGGQVEVKEYKGLSHALLMGAVAAPLRFLAPVLADSTQFIRAETGGAQSATVQP